MRARNSWEVPRVDLTAKVKSRGFVDCWERFGRPRPVKTCRFDTRIDYIFTSNSLLADHELLNVATIEDAASDHNLVYADFKV